MKMKKLVTSFLIPLLLIGCSSFQSLKESNQQSKSSEIKENVQALSPQQDDRDSVQKEVKEFLSGELTKVVVSKGIDDPSSIEIKDRSILKALPHILAVNQLLEYEPFPGGIRIDETPCIYKISSIDKMLSFEILADGIVLFKKDSKSYYFQSSNDAYLLGKAFIQKPEDIPDEPVLAKMYDSGLLMSFENGDSPLAYLSKFRIQGTVKAFLRMKKQEIIKPGGIETPKNRLEYYYFGNKIELNQYDKYLQIIDKENEYWYSANEPDINSVLDFLRAG